MSKAPLIYYVEDDEHIRDLTAYALHQAGMEVRAFHDGDGLVERCAAEPPDAVLLDIMLPGDDGLVLLQALRGNTATENMPIMMLTAKGTEFDKVVGLDAGEGPSGEGGVRIGIIRVNDTGAGIPADKLEKIFERFYRLEKSRSKELGGTGLGLAIVKHAALYHGGEVFVESEEDVGTRFTVRLPIG